ncbi:MAG TPA: prealbumin-like fold domain-containing protein [Rubrobacter sp.]|nr:prealbumin-like fold domain-containing protein [Rubrobacter sp.]
MMGWLSTLMERRPLRSWAIVAIVGALAMAAVLLAGMQTAQASHPEVSLAGSDFEIDTDANLKVDDAAPSIDWASVPQGSSANGFEVRKAEEFTGAQDNSFGQGTKEDTAVPTVVNGSIPPNKSDLLTFGVTLEENANGRFLHMYWHRVQEPSGTTNMDFEFNHATATSSNGVTPVREEGDILIQYDLAQGGTNPQLFLSEWVTTGDKSQCQAANSTPCWSDRINLSAADLDGDGVNDATGSINTSAIPASESDGLGAISPRTFGEATVDFDTVAGDDPCVGFGSAYLKSRSSDSFTAALKDFIAPEPLNIDRCGAIQVTKTAKHADQSGATSPNLEATFTVTQGSTTFGTITTDPDTGIGCLGDLPLGSYTVTETVAASGYALDTNNPKTANVTSTGSCSSGFTNVSFENTPLTDITVSVDSQVPGGTASTISCDDPDSTSGSTGAGGDGSITADDLAPGTYTCTVVVDP